MLSCSNVGNVSATKLGRLPGNTIKKWSMPNTLPTPYLPLISGQEKEGALVSLASAESVTCARDFQLHH